MKICSSKIRWRNILQRSAQSRPFVYNKYVDSYDFGSIETELIYEAVEHFHDLVFIETFNDDNISLFNYRYDINDLLNYLEEYEPDFDKPQISSMLEDVVCNPYEPYLASLETCFSVYVQLDYNDRTFELIEKCFDPIMSNSVNDLHELVIMCTTISEDSSRLLTLSQKLENMVDNVIESNDTSSVYVEARDMIVQLSNTMDLDNAYEYTSYRKNILALFILLYDHYLKSNLKRKCSLGDTNVSKNI